jgi:hypothetical protein
MNSKLSKSRSDASYHLDWWHRGDTKAEVAKKRDAKRRWSRANRRHAQLDIAERVAE